MKSRKALLAAVPLLALGVFAMWMLAGWAFGAENNAACYNASAAQESCQVRDVSGFSIISPQSPAPASDHEVETPTVEEVLKHGLDQLELSPTHIVVRGTGQSDSIRCEWHGVARTTDHREDTIRYWLGLDDNDDLPSPSDAKTRFMTYVDGMSPRYQETWAANLDALAKGGMTNDILFLACYIDYTTQEYILGSGSGPITVGYDQIAESTSFELYSRAHAAGQFRNEALMTEGEYQDHLNQIAFDAEALVDDIIGGHETVVFLAPMGSHGNVTVEAWQAVAQWDLQEDDDEVVNAVRFGTSEGDSEHTQTLANLKTRVTTAAAADSFADDRITSPTGLTQEYRDIGAYGDITPDDGETTTFTPAQPPPMPMCASGSAVPTPGTARGLVHDCGSLLAAKSTLAGTGTLNWGTTTASASWDGVTISGTPSRVTGLALASKSLTGTIPSDLGELFELTTLNLSNNQLTGAIPEELELLHNLTQLRLTGNQLTGCMPVALEDVATNDLSSLNLLYCQPPAPKNLAVTTPMETSLAPSWDQVSNTTKYRLEYRPAGVGAWTVEDETLTGTSSTVENLPCDRDHQFRVSAYGSGTTYAADWSDTSPALAVSTTECVSPVFPFGGSLQTVYASFSVGMQLRTITATDPNGDNLTYSITAGNEARMFSIGNDTGIVSVATRISHELLPVTLTIQAEDDDENTAQIEYIIDDPLTREESCTLLGAVPDPDMNPELIDDCVNLHFVGISLQTDHAYTWDFDSPMTDWHGVTVGGTPKRVTALELATSGLEGTIEPALSRLTGLTVLDLSNNRLTGTIPWGLKDLTQLTTLRLSNNQLTGCILIALKEVPTNDLGSLGLPDCPPPYPSGITATTPGETTVPLSWNPVPNASKYRVEYRVYGTTTWTVDDETVTDASHTVEGLPCNTGHRFRVRAYGDGVGYAEAWGTAHHYGTGATTGTCVSPVFDETSYEFSILKNAAMAALVGTVSATEPTDDAVTYSITAGNEARKFSIGSTSGEITLAASLDNDAHSSYSLTVKATDNAGDIATVPVEIAILPPVTVAFGQAEYAVDEDAASGIEITVVLSADAGRDVTVPITTSYQGGATSEDHGTLASSVTFSTGETTKTLLVAPVDDTVVDNGESIVLNFGTLPEGVTTGTPATATISIDDDEVPPPVTLWTATMTVGNSGGYLGYSTRSGSTAGSLTDDDFTWDGTTYTVTNILYNMYFDQLGIDFSAELTGDVEGIRVHLDDLELNMEDSGRGYRQPSWHPVILDWSVGDTVEMSLVYTAS